MRARLRPSSTLQPPLDASLLGLSLTMLCLGLAGLYSASAILAEREAGDSLFFFKKQFIFSLAGLALMGFFSRVDYRRLREWAWWIYGGTVLLLIAVLFTPPVAGVKRWIKIAGFGLQPAEFAKLGLLIFLADFLDRKKSRLEDLKGFAVPLCLIGFPIVLMAAAPDLGTPALLFAVCMIVLFLGGVPSWRMALLGTGAFFVVALELLRLPYRRARLFSFLDPFKDSSGAGYQLAQSLVAVGSGGLLGRGLGASKIKLLHLPAPHTDFIFPVLCEETGLLGAVVLLACFAGFLMKGMRIARAAPDLYGSLLATGIAVWIPLQAFFNIAMSIGLLPTKGLPLPFFSYGGSSMLVVLSASGILLNISRHGGRSVLRR